LSCGDTPSRPRTLKRLGARAAGRAPVLLWQRPRNPTSASDGKKIRRRPIVLYTDAMYDPNKTPAGMVGIVIYDPEDLASKWRYASAAVPQELIDKFRKRKQYVGQ
jgi:hypothetical protein